MDETQKPMNANQPSQPGMTAQSMPGGQAIQADIPTPQPQAATAKPRKVSDCRKSPSVMNCSLVISGTEDEVLDATVDHMVKVHGHQNTPELREEVRSTLTDEV